MTDAERERLGRIAYESSPYPDHGWEALAEEARAIFRGRAEAVARAVVERVCDFTGSTSLLRAQLYLYLDAPAEGHTDA